VVALRNWLAGQHLLPSDAAVEEADVAAAVSDRTSPAGPRVQRWPCGSKR